MKTLLAALLLSTAAYTQILTLPPSPLPVPAVTVPFTLSFPGVAGAVEYIVYRSATQAGVYSPVGCLGTPTRVYGLSHGCAAMGLSYVDPAFPISSMTALVYLEVIAVMPACMTPTGCQIGMPFRSAFQPAAPSPIPPVK